MDRERYGRGSGGGGGINRYPDVSGRTRPAAPARDDRNYSRGNDRPAPAPAGRSPNEPWSDVPPELEALLRAQVAQKPPVSRPAAATQTDDPGVMSEAAVVESGEPAPAKARAPRKTSTASGTARAAKAPAKPRAPRKTAASASTSSTDDVAAEPAAKAPAKPRATRKPAAAKATPATETVIADATEAAPKRRTTRKTTAPAEPV
jgi:hypothetical protein